jgi:hypothetical protein
MQDYKNSFVYGDTNFETSLADLLSFSAILLSKLTRNALKPSLNKIIK